MPPKAGTAAVFFGDSGRAAGQDIRGETPLHSRSDDLARSYSNMADDDALAAKKREAAMLFSVAEGHLEKEDAAEALKSATAALPLFRETRDVNAVHDTLRIIVNAYRMESDIGYEDKPAEAERFASQELTQFEEADDKRGQAAMLLSLAECACDNRKVKPSQLADAEGWARKSLDLFRRTGDDKMSALALLEIAHIHALKNEANETQKAATEARILFEKIGDKKGAARALHGIAIADVLRRKLSEALSQMKEVLAGFRELGIKKFEAFELCVMAEIYLDEEQPQRALPIAREALEIFRKIEYAKGWEAASLLAVSRALIGKQQPQQAVKAAQEGLSRLQDHGDKRQMVFGYEILANSMLAAEQVDDALEACEKAMELAKDMEDKRLEIDVLHMTGGIHMVKRDWEKAMFQMEDALSLAQELEDEEDEAVAAHSISFVHLHRGEHREASQRSEEACGLFAKVESKRGEAGALLVAATSCSMQGMVDEAVEKCLQAQDLFRAAQDLLGEGDACGFLAELHSGKQEFDAAVQAAERAIEVAQEYGSKRREAEALRLLTQVHLDARNFDQAERAATKAKQLASLMEDRKEMTCAQLLLTQVYLAVGADEEVPEQGPHPLEKALRSSAEAVTLSSRAGDRVLVAASRLARARLLSMTGRLHDAQRSAEEAVRWFRKAEDPLGEVKTLVLQGETALALNQKAEAKEFAESANELAMAMRDTQTQAEVADLLERIEKKMAPPKAVIQVQQIMSTADSDAPVVAAAADAGASMAKAKPKGLDAIMVQKKVMEITANLMAGDDDLENDSPFMEAGMDSLSSVQLMSELGKEFQMAMSPSLVFDFPTVRALTDHLVEESQSASY